MTEDVIPLLRSFLVQRYDQLKQRLALRLGNAELAEDALHETWLKLQRSQSIPGPIATPQAYLLRMAVNLDDLLSRLPPRRREILLLVRLEGWSQRDVAKRLGIPVRNVEYELKAAQDFLFSRLEPKSGGFS